MPKSTTTSAMPAYLSKSDLPRRYLEITRLRQRLQKAEQRFPHTPSAMTRRKWLEEHLKNPSHAK